MHILFWFNTLLSYNSFLSLLPLWKGFWVGRRVGFKWCFLLANKSPSCIEDGAQVDGLFRALCQNIAWGRELVLTHGPICLPLPLPGALGSHGKAPSACLTPSSAPISLPHKHLPLTTYWGRRALTNAMHLCWRGRTRERAPAAVFQRPRYLKCSLMLWARPPSRHLSLALKTPSLGKGSECHCL